MSLDRTADRAQPRSSRLPFLRLLTVAVPLMAAAAIHTPAHAGAGSLVTAVTALQPNVTYSSETATPPLLTLVTYVGYKVSIANVGGNTINNIQFTGTTSVTNTAEQAVFASIEGTTACTVSASKITINCTFGQLKAGEAVPTFTVFFKAPAKAPGSLLPNGVEGLCATTDCVGFAGQTLYAERTGGPNSVPDNSIADWGPVQVLLGTENPRSVKSAVQKSGGDLYTGRGGGLTTAADPFSTRVTIPPSAGFTTAEISEASITTATGCSVLPTCYATTLTIPGTFNPYLSIVLRLDAASIPSGTKIGSILISYEGLVIGDCASPTTPRGDHIPCIASRKAYPKNSRNGALFPVDLEGDFEWTVINTENGSYKVF